MTSNTQKPLVFISYADEDERIAEALEKRIRRTCTGQTVTDFWDE